MELAFGGGEISLIIAAVMIIGVTLYTFGDAWRREDASVVLAAFAAAGVLAGISLIMGHGRWLTEKATADIKASSDLLILESSVNVEKRQVSVKGIGDCQLVLPLSVSPVGNFFVGFYEETGTHAVIHRFDTNGLKKLIPHSSCL